VALLCLILGGATLMTLMMANIRDRIAEIGLRRALGAMPGDIASLFVIEACVITGSASLAGTVTAALLIVLGRGHTTLVFDLNIITLATPVIISLLLGVVFSYIPARMASHISPADALRND
jgi:putative ABC transport system permease protein